MFKRLPVIDFELYQEMYCFGAWTGVEQYPVLGKGKSYMVDVGIVGIDFLIPSHCVKRCICDGLPIKICP